MVQHTVLCFCACASLLLACSSNDTSSDGEGGSGGKGGTGGSGGSSDGGGGTDGDGGSNGGTGGTGGEGGMPPTGPCAEVPADTLGVIFTAPAVHGEGLVGISAWIDCPSGSGAVCQSVSWADPFAGCVAAADSDSVTCLFGTRPVGTKVHYIAALYLSASSPANSWFSWIVGTEVHKEGTHIVCLGNNVIGMFDGDSFTGALSDTDEKNPNGTPKANQMIKVP